jgi:hypothetical protein
MSPEENKAVVRRFVEEVFNQGNLAAVDQFLAADYRDANALPGQEPGPSPSWCPSRPGSVPASSFLARPPMCSPGGAAPGQHA